MHVTPLHSLGDALRSSAAGREVMEVLSHAWARLKPGGLWHPQYFIEHQGHWVVEAVLLIIITYLLFQNSQKPPKSKEKPLSKQEVDELCAEWKPEPLAGPLTPAQREAKDLVVVPGPGSRVTVNGKHAVSFASADFLGLSQTPGALEACEASIAKYGIGACGPRAFYGTMDVHMELESELAKFMGTEEAILYSYDLVTMSSILPAFANARDLVVCDEAVNWAIQNGCGLSRARVLTFKHNDVADLERVLQSVAKEDKKSRKPLNRRFIVVEGVYANLGDMAPVAEIMKLKEKYKYRVVVDESFALGVLGENGRGVTDLHGLAPGAVEIVSASLGNALACIGGFCAGERDMVDHQRLSGLGYIFSATSPPYTAQATLETLRHLQESGPALRGKLAANVEAFRQLATGIPGMTVVGGDCPSPLVHLRLDPPVEDEEGDLLLERLSRRLLERHGLLVAPMRYSALDSSRQPPSLKVMVTANHDEAQLKSLVAAIKESLRALR